VQETNGEDSEIYCTKKIGYITHDSELGIGRDFKVKNVATTCP
jgi:hypothetical protein